MIAIVKGSVEHAPAMHAIEAEAFAAAWSEISIKYEIMREDSICIVAIEENGEVVGHAYMRQILQEGHISNLAVKKSHRQRGIGSMLITDLIKSALEREMTGLTLEVRVSNTAAISLYEKHEFKSEGLRKNYYISPTEDGIVMWKYFD
ncbi:MAG: ribosomal protein S18-alanine N-acetyltransferase [Defluviitaleaceae bacterium]|nr:ribosomal protein S18-alanine N-acetyltransferase [Defluviitaleaceae bacterium]